MLEKEIENLRKTAGRERDIRKRCKMIRRSRLAGDLNRKCELYQRPIEKTKPGEIPAIGGTTGEERKL